MLFLQCHFDNLLLKKVGYVFTFLEAGRVCDYAGSDATTSKASW